MEADSNCYPKIDKEPISWTESKTKMWRQIQTAAKK